MTDSPGGIRKWVVGFNIRKLCLERNPVCDLIAIVVKNKRVGPQRLLVYA